jgi:magnesium chelatase family protein
MTTMYRYWLPQRRQKSATLLAPADLPKEGAAFDLPPARLERALVVGELSLDASVRPVRGVLPVALHARRESFTPLLVPAANAAEAAVVAGIDVIPIGTLHDAVEYLNGEREIGPAAGSRGAARAGEGDGLDFSDVRGQAHAKRGLEIAAAGAHNVLMDWTTTSATARWKCGGDNPVDF